MGLNKKYSVIIFTASSIKEARSIVQELLKEKLIACGNILSSVESHFVWKEKYCIEKEIKVVLKTKKELFKKVENVILKLHSYEVPEIIMLPIEKGYEKYLRWIDEVTI